MHDAWNAASEKSWGRTEITVVELPDKLYFRVGEVSQIAGVPAYVLRFWETEFKNIRPKRTASGQRLYRKQDIDRILTIKHLLYEKRFTIKGAKRYLKEKPRGEPGKPGAVTIAEIRRELESIRELLS